jgi:lipoprotein-anchoring transpeptidase ErfK/SrfK
VRVVGGRIGWAALALAAAALWPASVAAAERGSGLNPTALGTEPTAAIAKVGGRGQRITIRRLQRLLALQGYAVPRHGRNDPATRRAVLAFRRVNRMGWGTTAGPGVVHKLINRQGAYRIQHRRAGKHVEVSAGRQVMVLANGGRPYKTYIVSTGTASTPTVRGAFRFYGRQPGYNSHGMYFSTYFHGGYAVHGYNSVPNYPASHGCVRTPIPDAPFIYTWIQLGMPIYVY